VIGCVVGSFVGNFVGAILKNKNSSEINDQDISDVMNLIKNAEGLDSG
jgi:hypothetical protein